MVLLADDNYVITPGLNSKTPTAHDGVLALMRVQGMKLAFRTGGPSPRSRYATPPPPPLRALQAHLVTKGQWLLAIHRVAPKAPENFFSFPLPT